MLRETITSIAQAEGRYVRQSGGRGHYGVVRLRVEPLERGKGFEFANTLTNDTLPGEFIQPIEDGVQESLKQGIIAGYPIVDLRVTLLSASYLTVDSHESDFKIAGSVACKEAVRQAQPIVIDLDN